MRTFKKHNVERKASTDAAAEKLISKGYKEVFDTKETEAEDSPESKSLDKMKLEELKALAEAKKIEGYESLTKKELIAVLKDVV